MNLSGPATRAANAQGWIRRQQVIAILRMDDADRVIEICQTLVQLGLTVVEITADRAHAMSSIRSVRQALGSRVLLGAGTVLDVRTADAAAKAGADFCVAPNLDPEVVSACASRDMLAIPGVFTPTEIAAARGLGLSLLKLFPCGGLSPQFLSALRGPFPSTGFVPTGGIDATNVAGWFRAGAAAVGLGSSLVGRDGSADGLAERVREFRARIPGPAADSEETTDQEHRPGVASVPEPRSKR